MLLYYFTENMLYYLIYVMHTLKRISIIRIEKAGGGGGGWVICVGL